MFILHCFRLCLQTLKQPTLSLFCIRYTKLNLCELIYIKTHCFYIICYLCSLWFYEIQMEWFPGLDILSLWRNRVPTSCSVSISGPRTGRTSITFSDILIKSSTLVSTFKRSSVGVSLFYGPNWSLSFTFRL